MNSNWFKLVMKMTKVEYGKNLLLKGAPIIFNKGGAKLKIGENVTIKSSFLSNLVEQRFTLGRRLRLVRIPASAVTARSWIMTFIPSKQRRETSFCEMRTVAIVIWCQVERLRLARTALSDVIR